MRNRIIIAKIIIDICQNNNNFYKIAVYQIIIIKQIGIYKILYHFALTKYF